MTLSCICVVGFWKMFFIGFFQNPYNNLCFLLCQRYELPFSSLFESSHAEHVHFLFCEESPVATAYVLLCKPCELYTVELYDLVAEVFEDTSHDTVLSRVYFYSYLLLVCRRSILDGVSTYWSVFKLYAFCNLLDISSCDVLVGEHMVYLFLQEPRICKF